MASCKSYQNRKHEIEVLNGKLAEAEYQLRKSQQEFRVALTCRDIEIARVYREIEALQITLRLYRDYILKVYKSEQNLWLEIPKCLKPFDAVRYAGEREPSYGPDNQS